MWQVIRKNCTVCHGIDDYAFFSLDKPGWQGLIESKPKTGDFVLSSEDRSVLLDWLAVKFGPIPSRFRERMFRRRSPHSSPTRKPRDFWIGPVPHVMSWTAWNELEIRKSAGEFWLCICGSGERSFPTVEWLGPVAQTPVTGPILSLTAIADHVSGANDSLRIDVLRWSTDAKRDQLLAPWNLTAAPATAGGRGGRGGARRMWFWCRSCSRSLRGG